ncbi:hypothetical protein [Kistimonas asteriae]|uniref:hypothetical protein n=1 Tax=Kistimonas asteriae TaxID=517724 RepID=UPI001BAA3872|nr:hypothetical protein [Kistimonas asteriae]
MKPITTSPSTSPSSDTTVISAADLVVDLASSYGFGSSRKISIPPPPPILTQQELLHELKILGVQPRQGALFSSSENSSSASSSDEDRSILKKKVLQVEVSDQDMPPLESLSIEETSSELTIPSINLPISQIKRLWHSDPAVSTTKSDGPRFDIKLRSTVKSWSSCHEVFSWNQFQEKPMDISNIATSQEIPSPTLISTEEAQILEDTPDSSFFGESLLTHPENPEELMAKSQPEGTQIQPSTSDFPPGSGARPKTTPAAPKKKKTKKKKQLKKRLARILQKIQPLHYLCIQPAHPRRMSLKGGRRQQDSQRKSNPSR